MYTVITIKFIVKKGDEQRVVAIPSRPRGLPELLEKGDYLAFRFSRTSNAYQLHII